MAKPTPEQVVRRLQREQVATLWKPDAYGVHPSDREIAEKLGVSPGLVRKLRRQLGRQQTREVAS